MKITRDVIVDLLPLYLADEASDDTKTLVEQFLEQDPILAQQIQDQSISNIAPAAIPIPLTKESEAQAFEKTKGILFWRTWSMAGAIFFTLFTFLYRSVSDDSVRTYPEWGVHWFLGDSPTTLVVMAVVALALWASYFVIRYRLRETDL